MSPLLLEGSRVLVTRPARAEADTWAAALSAAGARVVSYPTIEVRPPPSWEPLDRALRQVGCYDWIIFTSKTAVLFTASRMEGGRFRLGRLAHESPLWAQKPHARSRRPVSESISCPRTNARMA